MPIYDCRCPDCGKTVELLVRTHDFAPPPCPSCEGTQLEKLPSAGIVARFAAPARAMPCAGAGSCGVPSAGCPGAEACGCGAS